MKIHYHKNFTKSFLKFPPKIRDKIKKNINLFQDNPHNPQLDNHALHGKQKGRRAISAGGDLRIVFIEKNHYAFVEIINAGTHTQVY